jgi:hypothetical protein
MRPERRLVLAVGGAHAGVLTMFAMKREPGLEVILHCLIAK